MSVGAHHLRLVQDTEVSEPSRVPPARVVTVIESVSDHDLEERCKFLKDVNDTLYKERDAAALYVRELLDEIDELRARLEMASATCAPPSRSASAKGEFFLS